MKIADWKSATAGLIEHNSGATVLDFKGSSQCCRVLAARARRCGAGAGQAPDQLLVDLGDRRIGRQDNGRRRREHKLGQHTLKIRRA